MEKQELLKLASDLEALATEDISDIDALTLYEQLRKEAESRVDVDGMAEAIRVIIDTMGSYKL